MAIPFWSIRTPWNTAVALDEFGPGTLNGIPQDGSSFDACGPASIENTAAAYEQRLPTYVNIGHIRQDMMTHGDWTNNGQESSPPGHTAGCTIDNVAAEIPRRRYVVEALRTDDGTVLTEAEIRSALAYQHAVDFIVINAQMLSGNEQNVHGHFVSAAAYGGDNADGSTGKLYLLNSDIAGQHGTATGQWTTLAQFLEAQPVGFAVMAPPLPPAVNPITQAEADIQASIASSQSALTALGSVPHA